MTKHTLTLAPACRGGRFTKPWPQHVTATRQGSATHCGTFTMSNFRRKRINERMQRKAAAGETEKIWIDGEDAEVAYHLFVGTRLIGSNTVGKFVNGAFLLVSEIGREGSVRLQDEDTKEEFETSVEQIAKHTKLRWALPCREPLRSMTWRAST